LSALTALSALKVRLANDAGLSTFFADHYGKAARHWLGYKRFSNANDYPVLCYVPVKTKRGYALGDQFNISVVLGLCNHETDGEVILGVSRCAEAEDLILAALANAIIAPGYKIERDAINVTYDLGSRHPFYETEFSLLVTQFDQLETGIVPSEVWLGLSPAIGTGYENDYEQVA